MMSLFEKHKTAILNAVQALNERKFFAAFPEHPKAYSENAMTDAEAKYKLFLNNIFELPAQTSINNIGDEVSPYTMERLGIKYPKMAAAELLENAKLSSDAWRKVTPGEKAGLLVEALEAIKNCFFEIGFATMHTTGQSFLMSFQASGPHAADRAMESIALGYFETSRYPQHTIWDKPMGKFNIKLEKSFTPVPKGIGLVIGCSTFPVWNTLPGVYADLITGNPVIIKPHPTAILPIAICVAEIQKVLISNGYNPHLVQLAVDDLAQPITKELAENPAINLIDYTGNTAFGDYLEKIKGKTVFTEKAGVNSVLLHSMPNLKAVADNLAFSLALYSGQMCTAPQNIFIPESGVIVEGQTVSYSDTVQSIKDALQAIITNPKMAAGTLGAIQNENTLHRVEQLNASTHTIMHREPLQNAEFPNARLSSPVLMEVNASELEAYDKELFGPIALIIKTKDFDESLNIASDLAMKHGAITCAAYTSDIQVESMISERMHAVFVPVSFNLTGFIWVNQHAAFSDFHVTGGNPAGNASYTNPEFIIKRFVWVGDRKMVTE